MTTSNTVRRRGTAGRLLFMRHCESRANANNILASRRDFPLSEQGLVDADSIARRYIDTVPEAEWPRRILCSPLTRAQQTARPFAERLGLSVETVPELVEHELGIFSGMTFAQTDDHPDYRHDKSKRWGWKPDGGESYQQIYERLLPLFLRFMAEETDGTTLCVSHAVTMRIVEALLSNTIPRYPVEYARNGEIWEVDFAAIGEVHTIRKRSFLS